ncbi:MAG: hypothetical protein J0L92_12960 [Deltaproteobacteria bacterium]|nr:hypothetical protein [Deltaproteobacteria bacterium]
MRASAILCALVAATSFGCVTTRPRTQLVVEIDAQERIARDAASLFVTVRGGVDFETLTGTFSDVVEGPAYPVRLTILPQGEDASRAWEVIVLAANSDGTVIGRQRARGRFLASTTVYTRLVLEDCCLEVASTCSSQETCRECVCTENTTVDPNEDAGVPPTDAGPALDVFGLDAPSDPDGGSDAGPIGCDSSLSCPGRPCETPTCERGVCTYQPLCAEGSVCCNGECAANCDCAMRRRGEVCRAASGECDDAEVCDGRSGACPPDVVAPAGSRECRGSAGACDLPEVCDGVARTCPTDAFVGAGTDCGGGSTCNGLGTCTSSCMEGAPCATSNPCAIGAMQCAGTPRCVDATPRPAGTVCRASAGPCDVAETCEGTTCPVDGFLGASTICRASASSCDQDDACNGASAACPSDAPRPAGTVCRASTSVCDAAESCDGSSLECPTDGFAPNTTACRAATGPCYGTALCTGTSTSCPPNPPVDGESCGPCGATCSGGLCRLTCTSRYFCCEETNTCARSVDECL